MWIPGVVDAVEKINAAREEERADLIIVGIEAHICVLQTTLDALAQGYRVWVVGCSLSPC